MFFKKKKETTPDPNVEEPVVDKATQLKRVQDLLISLDEQQGDARVETLDEIGCLFVELKEYDKAIHYLEMSLQEKKSLGKGYRTLLSVYNIKRKEAALAKNDEDIQYYLKKIDDMMALSKEVTRASF